MDPSAATQALAPEPLTGTDVGGFVLAVLAAVFVLQWWRDRERGLLALGAGALLLALWWLATPLHAPRDLTVRSTAWSALSLSGVALLALGLVRCLGTPPRLQRWLLPVLLGPLAVLVALLLAGQALPRMAIVLVSFITYFGTAALAFWTARREPGVGHQAVGLALLCLPATALAVLWWRGDAALARYLVVLPTLFLMVTLLTTSLLRRRRALEAEVARRQQAEAALTRLNQSLEQAVAERTADLQQLVQGLQSFNRSVSHDLRGPLGGIAALTRMALEALQRGEAGHAAQLLAPIADQAERSERLVGALLTLAHVGDAPLQRGPVDLAALARQALAELALAEPGHAVAAVQIGPLPTVAGDADLLRPVFVNLLGNALKFVREQAARLFEPFVRGHGGRYGGSGIGLSIVRRAVERHGGRVWAEGRPGAGATFHVSLPDAASPPH